MSKIRFVGNDGSMGLREGRLYDVELEFDNGSGHYFAVVARDGSGPLSIPYQSLRAFMNNWKSPKHK